MSSENGQPHSPADTDEFAGHSRTSEVLILLSLAAVQFTSIVDFMVVMPLARPLMDTLHISPGQFGWIVSSYTIAAGVAGFAASAIVDRFDRKAAFLALFVGFLVGTLACGLARTYPVLLAARVTTGLFGGVLGGMAMAIIGDVFPESRRGRATGALMSAFSIASVLGVPIGLYLGSRYGWQMPFRMLAGIGVAILVVTLYALPPLRAHLDGSAHAPAMRRVIETFSRANHLRAFALMVSLMLGGFAVVPYISAYYVGNVGFTQDDLMWIYVAGGGLSLFAAPIVGRLSDRFGKLTVYRVIAPVTALLMIAVTNLPRVPILVGVAVVGALMVSNVGRMVAAMSLITSSVEPARRGGFMSANSSVQHLASGIGSALGAAILAEGPDKSILHFDRVGWIGVVSTLASLWLIGRLQPYSAKPRPTTTAEALGAASEALADAPEPIEVAEGLF